MAFGFRLTPGIRVDHPVVKGVDDSARRDWSESRGLPNTNNTCLVCGRGNPERSDEDWVEGMHKECHERQENQWAKMFPGRRTARRNRATWPKRTPQPQGGDRVALADGLGKLSQLFERGLLSEDEFAAAKKRLLEL